MAYNIVLGLINYQNRSLLINRKNEPFKGLIGLCGGKVEQGESLDEALDRETREETGLKVERKQKVGFCREKLIIGGQSADVLIDIYEIVPTNFNYRSSIEGELVELPRPLLPIVDKKLFVPSDFLMLSASYWGRKGYGMEIEVEKSNGIYRINSKKIIFGRDFKKGTYRPSNQEICPPKALNNP